MQDWCALTFVILCLPHTRCLLLLPCQSEQDNPKYAVNCTAIRYERNNCSDSFLSGQYGDLYGQKDWPVKPDDLTLEPIQPEYKNTNLFYPGFLVVLKPPRSGIRDVQGFQINYEELDTNTQKCIIILIKNATMDHNHRDNNLRIVVKLWPTLGEMNYQFTAWSLPKPPANENDTCLIRYGRTGKYQMSLTDAQSDWLTTISYHNDIRKKYIRIWFVKAPVEYRFLEYTVKLEIIRSGEGTSFEDRDEVERNKISQTNYTFINVKPGRYRTLVQPYDDKFNTLNDCKCKTKGETCKQCISTKTDVIIVPADIPATTTIGLTSTEAPQTSNATPGTNLPVSAGNSDQATNKQILSSVLSFVAFIFVIVIVVVCYKLYRDRGNKKDKFVLPKDHIQMKVCSRTIGIVTTDDDDKHDKLVNTFATFLREACQLNILFHPWTPTENKDQWISNTLHSADYIVFVLSESAVDQYMSWTEEGYQHCRTFFMTALNAALNRSIQNPHISNKFIIVSFENPKCIQIPRDLNNMKQFLLTKQLKDFLDHIQEVLPSDQNLEIISECLNVNSDNAVRNYQWLTSVDSGFHDETTTPIGSVRSCKTLDRYDFINSSDIYFIPPKLTEDQSWDINISDLQVEIKEFNDKNMYGSTNISHICSGSDSHEQLHYNNIQHLTSHSNPMVNQYSRHADKKDYDTNDPRGYLNDRFFPSYKISDDKNIPKLCEHSDNSDGISV
ncbi:unnamed protein product [Mytilus edulis]|uniref:SEFIR domain-containing protein n=1 Tax=Mytilus edulis TaxID=6550 RepID=A0A8S3SC67_MYTED|nr:unnamed protein product [Mytilus edulis]